MNSKRVVVATIVMVLSSILLIALVGARGSFGFGKGSVVAFGEIQGKANKHGEVSLMVEKHPNAGALEMYTVCQSAGGTSLGNTISMNTTMSDSVSGDQLGKTKGAVIVAWGDLVADLSPAQLASIDAASACGDASATVVDAFPVGFKATITVMKNKQKVETQLAYVCGTTIAQGGASFSDGDAMSGTNYICADA